MKTTSRLKLTRDRRVVRRDTGLFLAQLYYYGPQSLYEPRGWFIEDEGVRYPTAQSAMEEIAMRLGL